MKATIWATAEPGTGIIAASITLLRPLVRRIASGLREKAESQNSHNTCNALGTDTIVLTSQDSVCGQKMFVHSTHSDGARSLQKIPETSWYAEYEDGEKW